jgi:tRNA (guanine-N7-)-methyltransferase
MAELLPQCAIDAGKPIDLESSGVRAEGHALEIGFGGGEHLAEQARLHPDWGFIGAEPFINGVAKMLARIEGGGLKNVRLHMGDARDVLAQLPPARLDAVYVLFPDPWPKQRHHKRRIVEPETLEQIIRVLKMDGELRVATDMMDYCVWTLMQVSKRDELRLAAGPAANWQMRPTDWPETRYEQKALAAGRQCVYLRFLRSGRDF